MARIALEHRRTAFVRLTEFAQRRLYGRALDPVRAMLHNRRVARWYIRAELGVTRFRALDHTLADLAVLATAERIGCSWCVDFGQWEGERRHRVDPDKLRHVVVCPDPGSARPEEVAAHDAGHCPLSELERAVVRYARAMSGATCAVTDDQVDWLRARLGEERLVELTMQVAVENLRARFNSALGLVGQGFSDTCEVPLVRALAGRGAADRVGDAR
ncbi:carboxymuconolactone decarboxylase family protein [Allostreptomyces psammosilenae]|uniref:Alkylhydroperoxidase family enzyme n=1 Tax=Allostreptomyces psammosilenae TaxID=1892865 RepID=A0A853A2I9_9ACTN|nr:carboxymuconolactone decarboxylase family protein [Allostreptomyces psammosilenae]NYI04971.1 alkylhydroperoxidase family enzyme [Allostreptomyces psammosilenae]